MNRMIVSLAMLIVITIFNIISINAAIAEGPPERIEVMGYPLTAIQNPSGGVTLDHCGPDMNKTCYVRYKYPTVAGSLIGSDIDMYYGNNENGNGYINAKLSTEIPDDQNALPFTFDIVPETQTFSNYNDWMNAINLKYQL